ncbi:TetR/AcrR family transcriptional regulator [Streptomyces albipurpureus]|uniref:TetR/AcrR family transcriptional regulator n=1 Tax=Streptomyces albipurpureus TaxID=2897419 RepID=A0ABT0UMR5_9ACTN|nr:TetR/AcrR family transcriptional regulator C-terminal domain-containing protein [Streptomyces sp. CWNU-1]MCM2389908.1 TetR/AcrR family transcriptional regulator [Streptomyces sp. CWNU-1]
MGGVGLGVRGGDGMVGRRGDEGRPPRISLTDIERVGRETGLAELTLQGVASRLGVASAALYRYVDGKAGLDRLVGESMLNELSIPNPPEDTAAHLLRFAVALREFVLDRPGMARYLQELFPRGAAGADVLAREITALVERGHSPDVAVVICSSVAGFAIAQAAAQERQTAYLTGGRDDRRMERQLAESRALLATEGVLAQAHANLPDISLTDYFRLVVTAYIRGLTDAAPPGRPLAEVMVALDVRPSPSPDGRN